MPLPTQSKENDRVSTTAHPKGWELAGAVCLLLVAAWLYWRNPLAVPPGLEMDELIEAQNANQVLAGNWQPFYEAGQGREGLYYFWLAAWLKGAGQEVFSIRMASSALMLVGLAVLYRLARQLFGPPIALLSLAIGTTSFWTIFIARSGLRSASLLPLAGLATTLFWSAFQHHQHAIPLFVASGVALGLSLYTHTAARVLPIVLAGFVLYLLVFHRSALAGKIGGLILFSIVATLVSLPLMLYLYAHPNADELGFEEFNRPLVALQQGDIGPALQTSLQTLGMFTFQGDPLIFDNIPHRPVFGPVIGLAFLLGIGIALARWRRPPYAFALLWFLMSLVPGMLSQPAPNFYRTAGAMGTAFAFPALALAEAGQFIRRHLLRRWVSFVWGGGTAILLAFHAATSWQAYFVAWPQVEGIRFYWQTGLSEAARYLDASSDTSATVLCTGLTYEQDAWWRPAWQSMPYLLRREDLAIRYYDCRSSLVIPAEETVRYLFPDIADPASVMPAEWGSLWLAEANPLPDVFPAGAGSAFRLEGIPAVAFPEGGLASWAPEAGGGSASLPVRFGSSLILLGYTLSPADPQPGEALRLVTAWEVLETPEPHLALFTHLLADPQTLIAQQDNLPLTSASLRPGDRFLVLHDQVQVPPEAQAGHYLIAIGLYDTSTLTRLSVYEGPQSRGDRLFLSTVQVSP